MNLWIISELHFRQHRTKYKLGHSDNEYDDYDQCKTHHLPQIFEFHAAFLNVKRQVEYNPMVRPYILYFPIRVHIQIYIQT